ncbi:MAG: hypothetical protein WCE21_05425 [Candidatus Babeliales bacterium]
MNRALYIFLTIAITLNIHAMHQLALRTVLPRVNAKSVLFNNIVAVKHCARSMSNHPSFTKQWQELYNTKSYDQLYELIIRKKDTAPIQELTFCKENLLHDKSILSNMLDAHQQLSQRLKFNAATSPALLWAAPSIGLAAFAASMPLSVAYDHPLCGLLLTVPFWGFAAGSGMAAYFTTKTGAMGLINSVNIITNKDYIPFKKYTLRNNIQKIHAIEQILSRQLEHQMLKLANTSDPKEAHSNTFLNQWNNLQQNKNYEQLHDLMLHAKDVTQKELQICTSSILPDKYQDQTALDWCKLVSSSRGDYGGYVALTGVTWMWLSMFLMGAPVLGVSGFLSSAAVAVAGHRIDEIYNERTREEEKEEEILQKRLSIIDAIEKLIAEKYNHKSNSQQGPIDTDIK